MCTQESGLPMKYFKIQVLGGLPQPVFLSKFSISEPSGICIKKGPHPWYTYTKYIHINIDIHRANEQVFYFLREAAKKVPPLMARPLRGGGGKGRAIKEKRTFF